MCYHRLRVALDDHAKHKSAANNLLLEQVPLQAIDTSVTLSSWVLQINVQAQCILLQTGYVYMHCAFQLAFRLVVNVDFSVSLASLCMTSS